VTTAARGGFRGFVERDRPFIDDRPAAKFGWDAHSRWGSRPFRMFGGAPTRDASKATRLLRRTWMWVTARFNGTALLVALALLAGLGLLGVKSLGNARAVPAAPSLIGEIRLGFGLDRDGVVSPGCSASTFSLNDPIHLSMQVTDAPSGAVVQVSVRDVATHRIAWSESRPLPPGRSAVTFEIGRTLAVGRYRVESMLGGAAASPRDFVVHEPRPGVRG
jgi:hypothetical protein